MQAFRDGDVAELLSDYSEQSVMYTSAGPVRGLEALKRFFQQFLSSVPKSFAAEYEVLRQDVDGDVAYTLWRSGSFALMGTDTFLIRDGKVAVQTTAAYIPSHA
ncbi:MAG: nuclear transport factor 2 family protein [Planctomycetota bacterium]